MPLESTITAAIRMNAEFIGWYVVKTHGGRYQAAGLPDLLCLRAGRAVWLEVKQPGKKPTKLQERRLAELRSAGCVAEVVTSVGEALRVLTLARPTGRAKVQAAVQSKPAGIEVR